MANITNFLGNILGGGARANQFEVFMPFPVIAAGLSSVEEFKYLCKAASLPASTIGEVPVPYRGRVVKLAGDRTYEDWETTIYNDTTFNIRNGIERWIDGMDRTLLEQGVATNHRNYYTDATVHQLDRNGSRIKTYTFFGMWPATLSAIELGYDTNDAVEEFTVTWKYNYFLSTNSITTI